MKNSKRYIFTALTILAVSTVLLVTNCGLNPTTAPQVTYCSSIGNDEVVNKIYSQLALDTDLRKQLMHIAVTSKDKGSGKEATIVGWVKAKAYSDQVGVVVGKDVCQGLTVTNQLVYPESAYTNKPSPGACGSGLEPCDGLCVAPGTCSLSMDF